MPMDLSGCINYTQPLAIFQQNYSKYYGFFLNAVKMNSIDTQKFQACNVMLTKYSVIKFYLCKTKNHISLSHSCASMMQPHTFEPQFFVAIRQKKVNDR